MTPCLRSGWLRQHRVQEWSMTMPTPCPHSQRLCHHHVRLVNDYFIMCPRSQWLCRHSVSIVNHYADTNFWKYQITFVVTFWLFFYFFQCPRSHIVVDYADTVSALLLTTRTQDFFPKTKKILKTVFACSYGAQVEFFDLKNVENLVTLSLSVTSAH